MSSKTTRSRVTNGKALFLERVDGRSLTARRYRDLYQAFIGDSGRPRRGLRRARSARPWTAAPAIDLMVSLGGLALRARRQPPYSLEERPWKSAP